MSQLSPAGFELRGPLRSLEALIASGDIALVRNSRIRSDIAGLQSVLEDATEDERLALKVRQQFFLPFVLERVPSQLVGGRNGATVLPPEITSQPAAAQVRSMLGDEGLINATAMRKLLTGAARTV